MSVKKQRPGANGAKLELETLAPNLIPPAPLVNGVHLVVATPEQLQAIVDFAVVKALGGASKNQSPEYLDAGGLCSKLKISVPTLRKMLEAGLPFLRCGELRRYNLAAVESWMASRGHNEPS